MRPLKSTSVVKTLIYLRKKKYLKNCLILLPSAFWVTCFLFIPLILILIYSFSTRGEGGTIIASYGLHNFEHFWTTPIYVRTIFKSIIIGIEVTIVCLLVGFLPAFYLARLKTTRRIILIILLIVPFWTSVIIRTYSWMLVLANKGAVNYYLMKWGLIQLPISFLYSEFAVILGLVHIMLPFMILPIFTCIDKIDISLEDGIGLDFNEVVYVENASFQDVLKAILDLAGVNTWNWRGSSIPGITIKTERDSRVRVSGTTGTASLLLTSPA